jgi:hypothetical protein
MSDIVTMTRFSRNREDCAWGQSERGPYHSDFERSQLGCRPANLERKKKKHETRSEHDAVKRETNLQDTPLELASQVWLHDIWLKRIETRVLRDGLVEMNESFDHDVSLSLTVGTMGGSAIDKRVRSTDEIGACLPLCGVLGDGAEEDDDGEGATEFVFLEVNASSPLPDGPGLGLGIRYLGTAFFTSIRSMVMSSTGVMTRSTGVMVVGSVMMTRAFVVNVPSVMMTMASVVNVPSVFVTRALVVSRRRGIVTSWGRGRCSRRRGWFKWDLGGFTWVRWFRDFLCGLSTLGCRGINWGRCYRDFLCGLSTLDCRGITWVC